MNPTKSRKIAGCGFVDHAYPPFSRRVAIFITGVIDQFRTFAASDISSTWDLAIELLGRRRNRTVTPGPRPALPACQDARASMNRFGSLSRSSSA